SSTYDVTLSLFQQGKSVEEIAIIRNLTAATIESHLLKLIEKKIISQEGMIDPVKMNTIQKLITEHQDSSITEWKVLLGDNYSFFEIRLSRLLLQS
ncbi:MAG: helix-turn-helix domain-containing protein, partial [Chitinophagaceae bacterium]